jgi:hypothetical protein
LLGQFASFIYEPFEEPGVRCNKLCEVYGSLRNICFTYFDYGREGVGRVA